MFRSSQGSLDDLQKTVQMFSSRSLVNHLTKMGLHGFGGDEGGDEGEEEVQSQSRASPTHLHLQLSLECTQQCAVHLHLRYIQLRYIQYIQYVQYIQYIQYAPRGPLHRGMPFKRRGRERGREGGGRGVGEEEEVFVRYMIP